MFEETFSWKWKKSKDQCGYIQSVLASSDLEYTYQGQGQGTDGQNYMQNLAQIKWELCQEGWSPTWTESESQSRSVMSDSLWPQGLFSQWNSPGQNTGVVAVPFSGGIFPTQRTNPGLLHCRWILYKLSHQESTQNAQVMQKAVKKSKIILWFCLGQEHGRCKSVK